MKPYSDPTIVLLRILDNGLRNRIVHGYDKVKKSIIWTTIINDLPSIKSDILKILNQ